MGLQVKGRSEHGFTVVEVLVSVALVAMVAVAIMPLFAQTSVQIGTSSDDGRAAQSMPIIIDDLKLNTEDWLDADDTAGVETTLETDHFTHAPVRIPDGYGIEVKIIPDPYATMFPVYQAEVRLLNLDNPNRVITTGYTYVSIGGGS